jgi:hypothetical protein
MGACLGTVCEYRLIVPKVAEMEKKNYAVTKLFID